VASRPPSRSGTSTSLGRCDYVSVRNPDAKDGLSKLQGARQVNIREGKSNGTRKRGGSATALSNGSVKTVKSVILLFSFIRLDVGFDFEIPTRARLDIREFAPRWGNTLLHGDANFRSTDSVFARRAARRASREALSSSRHSACASSFGRQL
jgi:hypothetical protein